MYRKIRNQAYLWGFMVAVLVTAGIFAVADVRAQAQETRDRQLMIMRSLNASCKLRNEQLGAIAIKDEKLMKAEYANHTPGIGQVVKMRLEAYQEEIDTYNGFTDADCDRLFPVYESLRNPAARP